MITKIQQALIATILILSPLISMAEDHWYSYDHLYLQGGSYVHYSSGEDKQYAGSRIFVSIEAVKKSDWFYGLSLFDNSFGQFSQYLYFGKSWTYSGMFEGFHTKLTGGIIHGYKDEFRDKIPFNSSGFAPAIIPGVGYKKGRFGVDMIFLGTSALLFTIGMDL